MDFFCQAHYGHDQKGNIALQRIVQFKQQYCAQLIILQFGKKIAQVFQRPVTALLLFT